MVRAGPWKWQAQRDIHPFIEGVELERDQTLVMIHAQNAVELALYDAIKKCIRRMRARNLRRTIQGEAKRFNCRRDDIDLFSAQIPILTGVRVQTGNCNTRPTDAANGKERGQEASHSHDFRLTQKFWDIGQRNMRRDKRDGDLAARQAHRKIADPATLREEFGLSREIKTCAVHGFLGYRAGNDCLDLSRSGQRDGLFECLDSMLRGSKFGSSWRKGICRADEPIVDISRKATAFQGGPDNLRSDTGRIAAGDPHLHVRYERILM